MPETPPKQVLNRTILSDTGNITFTHLNSRWFELEVCASADVMMRTVVNAANVLYPLNERGRWFFCHRTDEDYEKGKAMAIQLGLGFRIGDPVHRLLLQEPMEDCPEVHDRIDFRLTWREN